MAVLFDTLKLADRLEAAGMPPEQARGTATALAEGLTGTVATAADIETVRGEIRESELRLRAEIASLRAEMIRWIVGTGAVVAVPIIGLLVPILIKLH